MNDLPEWNHLVADHADWAWRNRRLTHKDASNDDSAPRPVSALHRLIVRYVYATHNDSAKVTRKLNELLRDLTTPENWGLNIGAGGTQLHPKLLNLDIYAGEHVQVVARGQALPFKDNSLKLIVSQEVIEHLPDPQWTIREAHRVLAVGGRFYCQVPFIIGYHPGPHDYWRFTKEGIAQLFADSGWKVREVDTSVGFGTGAYRIAVECFAVAFSVLGQPFYLPAKGLGAALFLPIKLLDLVSDFSAQRDRIPGGYFCVAEKVK